MMQIIKKTHITKVTSIAPTPITSKNIMEVIVFDWLLSDKV